MNFHRPIPLSKQRLLVKLYLFAFIASFILQSGLQSWFASVTNWGANHGWQNEIAFWNLGLSTVILLNLRDKTQKTFMPIIYACLILSLCFGTNHLIALLSQPDAIGNWAGAVFNFAGVLIFVASAFSRQELH